MLWSFCLLASSSAVGTCLAQENEFDNAKWKLQAHVWISYPSGYFNGKNGNGYFDLQRDFGFGNYATFSGKLDWRFKRKHHLLFSTAPVISSRTTTLERTIEWQGQTFDLGARVEAHIQSLFFTPGYQYDFFRRRSGYLGLLVNVNLAFTDAKLKAATTGGAAAQADGSLFAPLPAIGPAFRWYPLRTSDRFYLDGTLVGMSFFGYGNFVSGSAVLGIPISPHWDVRAGYLMGSRLKISGSTDNIAIRLTQKGPVFGIERHWGTR
ncbi:MAG TPA: hypothetical protein VK473_03200 [Terriglobales bacterium]|nr:hypothetical protein [Terriglobales bacterium]